MKWCIDTFREYRTKPIESHWAIRLLNAPVAIPECNIALDGNPLMWWDSEKPNNLPRYVPMYGGVVAIIPTHVEFADDIEIWDDYKTIWYCKYIDVPEGTPSRPGIRL